MFIVWNIDQKITRSTAPRTTSRATTRPTTTRQAAYFTLSRNAWKNNGYSD